MKRRKLFTIVLAFLLASLALEALVSPAAAQGGWLAEYYANGKLSGAPVLVRYDAAIDFDWKDGSPDPAIAADNFSVRWARTLYFSAGTYRFFSSSNEGARIDVDGARVLEAWDGPHTTRWDDVVLTEGQHAILVEYYEGTGNANVHVWWDRLGTSDGWEGRYYDNAELRSGPVLIRDDAEINFDWGEGAPAAGMPSDNFSVSWTRQVNFAPGYYRLNARADDGVRVWMDGGLVMDYWRPQEYEWHYADGFYLAGNHTLKVDYFERAGGARIRFWWEPNTTAPSPVSPTPVPAPAPSPAPLAPAPGPWQGEYFNNQNLSGNPVLVSSDPALDLDWGFGSPAPEVMRDNFSARWSGTFQFNAGRYSFTTYSDDGVRLYVDGKRVINSWRPMRGTRSATVDLSEGAHTVRVEYFERTGRAQIRVSWQRVGAASKPTVSPVPTTQPATCEGGPLRLDAWPVAKACNPGGGWTATIFVQGHGGNCQYTYAWEGQVKGGPTSSSMTFGVKGADWNTAIVGAVTVTSAGETVKVKLHIPHPSCQ